MLSYRCNKPKWHSRWHRRRQRRRYGITNRIPSPPREHRKQHSITDKNTTDDKASQTKASTNHAKFEHDPIDIIREITLISTASISVTIGLFLEGILLHLTGAFFFLG
jgi:hypothetical protein